MKDALNALGMVLLVILLPLMLIFGGMYMYRLQTGCTASGGILVQQPLGYVCFRGPAVVGVKQ